MPDNLNYDLWDSSDLRDYGRFFLNARRIWASTPQISDFTDFADFKKFSHFDGLQSRGDGMFIETASYPDSLAL